MYKMIIVFSGADGAGKTTQAKLAYEQLTSSGYKVEILDKWDIFDLELYPECRFLLNSLGTLQDCISEMDGAARALFLFWSIEITLKKMKKADKDTIFISDGFWIKHAASEIVFGQDKKWIESMVSVFPKPDLVFYFEIDPAEAAKRKKYFTAYECGRDSNRSIQSFIEHQNKVKKILNDWCGQYEWVKINSIKDKISINEFIKVNILQKLGTQIND